MKIPKKLKIGAHTFTVEFKKLKGAMAESDYADQKIYIEKDAKQSSQEASFLHEIICHCINTTFTEDHKAHAMMDSYSEQIYQVLKDNKLLK
jgi:hypothetical protein